MTVSIEATSKKYRGRKAATYESIRKKQERWDIENKAVEQFLTQLQPRSVLDVPVGTGRFFKLYKKLKVERVAGVDVSDEMLMLARKRLKGETVLKVSEGTQTLTLGGKMTWMLEQGDARHLEEYRKDFDVAVVVRFLDLIDEKAMQDVMKSVCERAKSVVLTIRFGDKYLPKSNTAEHDRKKFMALVKKLGFVVEGDHPVFKAGWHVLLLRRST